LTDYEKQVLMFQFKCNVLNQVSVIK